MNEVNKVENILHKIEKTEEESTANLEKFKTEISSEFKRLGNDISKDVNSLDKNLSHKIEESDDKVIKRFEELDTNIINKIEQFDKDIIDKLDTLMKEITKNLGPVSTINKRIKELEDWEKLMYEIGYSKDELVKSGPTIKQINDIQLRRHKLQSLINYDHTYVLNANGFKNLYTINEIFKIDLDTKMIFSFNFEDKLRIGEIDIRMDPTEILVDDLKIPRLHYSISKCTWMFIAYDGTKCSVYDAVNDRWMPSCNFNKQDLIATMFQCAVGDNPESLVYDTLDEYLGSVVLNFSNLYSEAGLAASGETAMYMVSNLQKNTPISELTTIPKLDFQSVGIVANVKFLNWREQLPKAMWIKPYIMTKSDIKRSTSEFETHIEANTITDVIVGGEIPYIPDFVSLNNSNELVFKSSAPEDSKIETKVKINDEMIDAKFGLSFLVQDITKIESPKAYFMHNNPVTHIEKDIPRSLDFDNSILIYEHNKNFKLQTTGYFLLETDIDALGAGDKLQITIDNVTYNLTPITLDGKLAWKSDTVANYLEIKPNADYNGSCLQPCNHAEEMIYSYENADKTVKVESQYKDRPNEMLLPTGTSQGYTMKDVGFQDHNGVVGEWFYYKTTDPLYERGDTITVRHANVSAHIEYKAGTGECNTALYKAYLGDNLVNDFTDKQSDRGHESTRKIRHDYNGYLCNEKTSLIMPYVKLQTVSMHGTSISGFNTQVLRPPRNILTPIALSHDLIFATNDIKRLQSLINKMWDVITNIDKRVEYLDEWCDSLQKQINMIVKSLNPDKSLHIGQIISMLSGAIGMFMPLVGIAGEALGALIDGIENMAQGDYTDGAIDFVLAVVMSAYGIRKFLQRRVKRYKARDDLPSYESLFGKFHGTSITKPNSKHSRYSKKKSKGSVLNVDLTKKKISKFEYNPESKGWRFTIGPSDQKSWDLVFKNGKPTVNKVEINRQNWIKEFLYELNSVTSQKRRAITTQPIMTSITLLCEAPSGNVKKDYELDSNSEFWLKTFKDNPDFCEQLLSLDDVAGV